MVEQIRISPEEVRGYGNICEEHSLDDFIVSSSAIAKEKEDMHGALTNVYKLVYSFYGLMFAFDNGNKQLYLQMGEADILSFGFDDDSKQLYLLDMARTGLSLGFDEDTNELYISDAPPIVHNYSLAFSSSSYVATDGSAEVSVTLLDDNVAVSGATISFTGGTATVSGVTNSSGVATATVSVSATSTITATYQNVTDTCTVTVGPSYLFYDACDSSTGLSSYGQIVPISSSTTTSYLEYNSTQNAYYVHANGDWGVIPITSLNGLDNYKITAEFKTKASGNTYQGGIGFIAETGTNNVIFRKYGTTCNSAVNDSSQQNIGTIRSANSYWHKFEITKQGKNFSVTVTDVDNDTVIGTLSRTISFDTYYVGFMTVAGQSYGSYVRNVKVESL